jgi:hypothetical protein
LGLAVSSSTNHWSSLCSNSGKTQGAPDKIDPTHGLCQGNGKSSVNFTTDLNIVTYIIVRPRRGCLVLTRKEKYRQTLTLSRFSIASGLPPYVEGGVPPPGQDIQAGKMPRLEGVRDAMRHLPSTVLNRELPLEGC